MKRVVDNDNGTIEINKRLSLTLIKKSLLAIHRKTYFRIRRYKHAQ